MELSVCHRGFVIVIHGDRKYWRKNKLGVKVKEFGFRHLESGFSRDNFFKRLCLFIEERTRECMHKQEEWQRVKEKQTPR